MRIVVTGSSGMLGKATVQNLCASGHSVLGVDATPLADAPCRTFVGDLREPFTIHRALDQFGDRPDAIVHLANHRNAESAPGETVLRENLAMNTSVVMAALQRAIPRLVFSSSIQAFVGGIQRNLTGEIIYPDRFPIDESLPPKPMNPYGLSKLLTEHMLDHLCNTEQFQSPLAALSLRFPYLMPQHHIEMVAARTTPTDYRWGGAEAFAYLHMEDAAEAVRLACEARTQNHQVLWLAAPDPRTPESPAELATRFYESVPGVETVHQRNSFVDCSRARSTLGWEPTRTITLERAAHAARTTP